MASSSPAAATHPGGSLSGSLSPGVGAPLRVRWRGEGDLPEDGSCCSLTLLFSNNLFLSAFLRSAAAAAAAAAAALRSRVDSKLRKPKLPHVVFKPSREAALANQKKHGHKITSRQKIATYFATLVSLTRNGNLSPPPLVPSGRGGFPPPPRADVEVGGRDNGSRLPHACPPT